MKTANEISPLARVAIKANNIIVWKIASESGHTYQVTIFEARVTSCARENGETCPGFHHSGTCHHAVLALSREQERRQEQPRPVEAYLPPMHSAKGFSLLK